MGSSTHKYLACLWYLFLVLETVFAREFQDFIAINTLSDGEVETRIQYKRLQAKETTVGIESTNGVKYRQILEGNRLLQIIYDDSDIMRDCEFTNNKNQAKTFLFNFKNDLVRLKSTSNLTVESLDNKFIPNHIKSWLNFKNLRKKCDGLHSRIESEVRKTLKDENQNSTKDTHLRHHKTARQRRSLIAPGTRWCGKANDALKYTDLGLLSGTDKCCRRHDHCQSDIPGLTHKFGYYNGGPFTLSHCFCDQSFRTCLKMVGTSDANIVGKIFFNVIRSQCFILKHKKKCIKRSWWGDCEKHKYRKRAVLRDNLYY